ncbi:MAG: 3'-5' exonuclease [Bacteroidales bacterium]
MSLNNIPLNKILFLDIETVSQYRDYNELPEVFKQFWSEKAAKIDKDKTPDDLYERAGIYAEFGKIICISVGLVYNTSNGYFARIKSYYGHDEKDLLMRFFELLNTKYSGEDHFLCAHNGKEFDFPYIARRALIHRIKLPKILDIAGCKPWEVRHLDTMELWRFGDYKSYTSLNLLSAIFDIPSPKDDISGKDIYRIYYHEKDLNRIVTYCQKDVVTLIRVFMSYRGDEIITDDKIEFVK